jgi:hypothetical protein
MGTEFGIGPGLVRVSFGMYNTHEEIDFLVGAPRDIALGRYRGTYDCDVQSGECAASNWSPDLAPYFSLGSAPSAGSSRR